MIERVRCPQCRGVLAPPPGLQRFRCPCGAVLALQGGPMWRCNVCSHTNPTHRSTCEMCGTQKGVKPSDSNGSYASKRVKLLRQGKRSWKKHMDDDKKIRWVRVYRLDSNEIDREPIGKDELKLFSIKTIKAQLRLMDISCKKAVNRKDLELMFLEFYEDIPSYSSAELKDKLRLAGVDDSKCVEKSDLVTLLRQSIHCNLRGKFDGWVRSFNKSGDLSWIPANKWFMDAEIRLPNGNVLVDVKELRNASTLTFSGKLGWFRHKLSRMRVSTNTLSMCNV